MNKPNLPQQPPDDKPDFLVGDVVVFIDDSMHDELMAVSSVEAHSVFMDDGAKFALSFLIRSASVQELNAGRRLGEVKINA